MSKRDTPSIKRSQQKVRKPVPRHLPGHIAGRYRVLSLLGTGGTGEVVEAYDLLEDRPVALKILKRECARNTTVLGRFLREAQAVGRIDHPGIVRIFDTGVDKSGLHFIVMDIVQGVSLKDLIKDKVRMPASEVGRIAAEVCEVMQVAHSMKIIHRDLKPSNLLIPDDWEKGASQVRVVDFGTAKISSTTSSIQIRKLTSRGEMVGTPQYMAPEQAAGRTVDARADLYALGCIMYQALSGHIPFNGPNHFSIIVGHMERSPVRLDELMGKEEAPKVLADFVHTLMAKSPDDRPVNAAAAEAELRQMMGLLPEAISDKKVPSPEDFRASQPIPGLPTSTAPLSHTSSSVVKLKRPDKPKAPPPVPGSPERTPTLPRPFTEPPMPPVWDEDTQAQDVISLDTAFEEHSPDDLPNFSGSFSEPGPGEIVSESALDAFSDAVPVGVSLSAPISEPAVQAGPVPAAMLNSEPSFEAVVPSMPPAPEPPSIDLPRTETPAPPPEPPPSISPPDSIAPVGVPELYGNDSADDGLFEPEPKRWYLALGGVFGLVILVALGIGVGVAIYVAWLAYSETPTTPDKPPIAKNDGDKPAGKTAEPEVSPKSDPEPEAADPDKKAPKMVMRTLEIHSDPPGAQVMRGEEVLGKTPMSIGLEEDTVLPAVFLLQLPRHESEYVVVNEADLTEEGLRIKRSLERLRPGAMARVEIITDPPGAEVQEDGRYIGLTPVHIARPAKQQALRLKLIFDDQSSRDLVIGLPAREVILRIPNDKTADPFPVTRDDIKPPKAKKPGRK